MKYIRFLVLCWAILQIGACSPTVEIDVSGQESAKDEVMAELYVGLSELVTRSSGSESVSDLRVLVFDENHKFLYSRTAIIEGMSSDELDNSAHLPDGKKEGIEQKYKIRLQLLSSEKIRHLHFIANYDWTGFKQDYFLLGKSAGEIIPQLISRDGKTVYWQHLELANISSQTLKGKVIKLLRNTAMISLQKSKDRSLADFEIMGFKVYDSYSDGTVAPYIFNENDLSYLFPSDPRMPTIAHDYSVIKSTRMFSPNESAVLYERPNRDKKDGSVLFLIVKAKYAGTDSFYKLDLVKTAENGTAHLLDVLRNHWYIFTINEVNAKGYFSEEEAAQNPASNNIFASVELEKYGSISDGKNSLEVSPIASVMVQPGMFNCQVKFAQLENVKVYPEWKEDDNYISMPIYNRQSGIITVGIKNIPDDRILGYKMNVVAKAANGNYLSRQVRLTVRKPYTMYGKSINTIVYNKEKFAFHSKMKLTLIMPTTIPWDSYPFKIYIKTDKFTPVASENPLLIVMRNGTFYYEYTVTRDMLLSHNGELSILFDNNLYEGYPFNQDDPEPMEKPSHNTKIVIESPLFERYEIDAIY